MIAAMAIPLWLNAKATVLVCRDQLSERSQKIAQITLVWVVPIIGAIGVLAVHRPKEKSPGKYPKERELDDDGPSGSPLRTISEAIDGD